MLRGQGLQPLDVTFEHLPGFRILLRLVQRGGQPDRRSDVVGLPLHPRLGDLRHLLEVPDHPVQANELFAGLRVVGVQLQDASIGPDRPCDRGGLERPLVHQGFPELPQDVEVVGVPPEIHPPVTDRPLPILFLIRRVARVQGPLRQNPYSDLTGGDQTPSHACHNHQENDQQLDVDFCGPLPLEHR